MEPTEYESLLRHLMAIAAHQDTINDDIRASILKQGDVNERLAVSIDRIDQTLAHVAITQARVETLLARMLRDHGNGREA